jgi:hypothetical protein
MDVDDDRPPDFGLQPSAHLSFQLGNISKLEIAKNEASSDSESLLSGSPMHRKWVKGLELEVK